MLLLSVFANAGNPSTTKIAIIIDDIGYDETLAHQAATLPFPVTMAIIPFTPHALTATSQASANNKEVMLHIPMQALSDTRIEPGLNVTMDEQALHLAVDAMLAAIPSSVGVNNHGGSRFSMDAERTDWLLKHIQERGLYFVDSRTTALTEFPHSATSEDMRFTSRDVFLDNQRDKASIIKQMKHAIAIAKKKGSAVVIGHPYPETLAVLREFSYHFDAYNVEPVVISDLLPKPELKVSAQEAPLTETKETAPIITTEITPSTSNQLEQPRLSEEEIN